MKNIPYYIFASILLTVSSTAGATEHTVRIRILSKFNLASLQITADEIKNLKGRSFGRSMKVTVDNSGLLAVSTGTRKEHVKSFDLADGEHVRIKAAGTNREVFGTLHFRVKRGFIYLINEVPLEEYVKAVLVTETADLHEPQALVAMAIVSRSYSLAEKGRHASEGFDFCDLTHCQVYKVPKNIPEKIKMAVEESANTVLTYNGKVAETFYHANCGGETEDAYSIWKYVSAPYLTTVSDKIPETNDYYCAKGHNFHWKTRISSTEMRRVALNAGWMTPKSVLAKAEVITKTPSGRVGYIRFKTGGSGFRVTGSRFYRSVGRSLGWNKIRSTNFKVSMCGDEKKSFCFEGQGYGHGVGLCQDGADGMAKAGLNAEKILDHYFKGTKLQKLE